MSGLRLGQIFAVALLVLLVGLAPLQLGLNMMGGERLGLGARAATGTIWRGELKEARLGGVDLGDVDLGLHIPGLLLGGGRVWFDAQGPMSARGVAVMTRAEFGVVDFEASLPLEEIMSRAPVRGRLRLEGGRVAFRHGACSAATGRVTIDRISLPGGAQLAPGLALSGVPTCKGGLLIIPLSGQADGIGVHLLVTIDASGGYRLETLLRAANPSFEALMALTGFERTMRGFVRVDQGRLGVDASA
jgi:hypothetical protein